LPVFDLGGDYGFLLLEGFEVLLECANLIAGFGELLAGFFRALLGIFKMAKSHDEEADQDEVGEDRAGESDGENLADHEACRFWRLRLQIGAWLCAHSFWCRMFQGGREWAELVRP